MVWSYLACGTVAAAFLGKASCRICGENVGTLEYTDGVYQWPEGLAHYIDVHSIRLPLEVVKHATDQMNELEQNRPAIEWWLAKTTPARP